MFELLSHGWIGLLVYALVDCAMIVLGVQLSDAITKNREDKIKKKFEDIICDACQKGGKKLYRCADKTTWLCWKCKPVFNSEWRAKQKEQATGAE